MTASLRGSSARSLAVPMMMVMRQRSYEVSGLHATAYVRALLPGTAHWAWPWCLLLLAGALAQVGGEKRCAQGAASSAC